MNMELEEEGSSSQEGSQEVLCPPNSCPVCLSDLDDCQLGRPNSCSHLFCLNCIKEWSKVRFLISSLVTSLIRFSFFYKRMSIPVQWIEYPLIIFLC